MSDSQSNTCVIHGQATLMDRLRPCATPIFPDTTDQDNLCVHCLANDVHLMYRVVHRYSPSQQYLDDLANNIALGEGGAMLIFNNLVERYGNIPSLQAVRKRHPLPPRRLAVRMLPRDRYSHLFPVKRRGDRRELRKNASHRYCSGPCCTIGTSSTASYLQEVREWRAGNHPRPVPRNHAGSNQLGSILVNGTADDLLQSRMENISQIPSGYLSGLRHTGAGAIESFRKWRAEERKRGHTGASAVESFRKWRAEERKRCHTRNVSTSTSSSNDDSTTGLLPGSGSGSGYTNRKNKKGRLALFNCRALRSSCDGEKDTTRSKSSSSPRRLWEKVNKKIKSASRGAHMTVDADVREDTGVLSGEKFGSSTTLSTTAAPSPPAQDIPKRSKWGLRRSRDTPTPAAASSSERCWKCW